MAFAAMVDPSHEFLTQPPAQDATALECLSFEPITFA